MSSDLPMVVDHDVFIVHADDDTPFVKGELLPMLGLSDDRVILSSELPFPAFTEQAIEDAVRRGRLTLAVLSPAYLRDHWAGFAELLSRNVRDDGRGGSLVPLLIADCDAPAILAQHEMLDCRSPQQRETSAARLRARLGRPDPLVEQIACPYPGMQPFSAATAAQFHGRAKEIDELLGRIQAGEREIYVIGPSGSGKSSLVAAGVIPRLQSADGSLGRHRFAVRTFRPGDHPMQRLAEALACDPSTLDGVAGRLLQAAGADRLLFLVDQFEELFALADAQERHQFVRALRVLRTDHRCHLIIALRADFYGALMSSELWPDIDGRFTRLEIAPLYGAALREAIELPTRNSGVYLERELVERLISDAAAEPGALPLLQEALVLLWGRRSHRLLRLTSYDELGSDGQSGLAVALARRADAVLHDFKPSQQRLFRRIFLRLVSFGEGRPDTRRQQPRAALSTSGEDAESVDKIIDQLIDERMLTSDATAHGEPLIDLSHEALIAGWPAFQGWLLTRRDDEQRRRLLELHVAEWVKRGRGSAGLFDAIELAEAERWIAGETAHELGYSDDLPRFLAASRAAIEEAERQKQLALEQQALERRTAQDERTRLRRRLARFAIVALTLFSIIASIIGLVAWRQRLEAERQRLEAQLQHQKAQLQLGRNEQEQARSLIVERNDPIGAIPHLLQAVNFGVDDPVLRTLLAEVKHGGVWRVAVRHGAPISTAAFSPDGTRIVTTGQDGAVRIWDAATGTPLGVPLKHEKKVRSASLSLDGSRLVSTDEGGAVRVWDASTGAPLGVPLKNKVRSAAFSPDGTRVVTIGYDGTACVWDVATGTPLGVPLKPKKKESQVAEFSPDGTRVVTAGYDGIARVWDVATGTPLSVPLKHEKGVGSVAFSPDGTRVVTVGGDGIARVWDVATGTPLSVPLKDEKGVYSAAFSPDGTRVVTVGGGGDGTARVWDVATRVPLGVTLNHGQPLTSAAFSPDGSRLVTASYDGTARVWNAATGAPLGVPLKHEGVVTSAAFSPDGSRLLTASLDGTARVWDTEAPLGIPLKHKDVVVSAAFNADGTRVVTASLDGTARIWDAATGAQLGVSLKHEGGVTSAAFSPDGTRVVTISEDRTARVWNAATGAPLGVPLKHEREVAAFSPDGSRIVTAGEDGTARIWDVATRAPLGIPLKHEKAIRSATFSSDGSRVLTASEDGTARVWNAATGTPLGVPLKHKTGVYRATFSHDGSRVATVDYHETARVWDVATGTQLGVLLKYKNPVAVLSVGFSPRGTHVVTANDDGTARVWDAATGKPVGLPLKHEEAVRSAAFSPDGSRVVTTSADGTARVWDAATGNPVGLPLKHEKNIWSAAFSPDGSRVVTAGGDGTARVWDTATGTPVGLPLKHERAVDSAAFTSDGTRVVTTSNDGTACVWDAATGASLAVPLKYGRAVWSATFSQDGTRVVTISEDGTARVWDAATATQLGVTLKYEKNIGSAAFSPDGSRVVTTGEDGTARVWDAATGTALGVTLKHGQEARIAVFNPDGTHIVTAGSDGTAHAWDAATGAPLAVTLKHGQAIRSVAFSPDGTRVVTTGKDGTARIWNATTGTQLGVTLQHEPMVESAAFSPDGSRVVTAGGDGTARVWDATTGAPLGAPLKHEHDVMSAAFSPDGYRLLTASVDGTARLWNLVETRALSGWVEQARKCVTPRFDTADSVAICPLSAHETTPSELLARALSLTAAGDAAMFAHVSPLPRAQYQRAIELLDDNRDLVGRVNEHEGAELRRAVSLRLAVLDAVEGRLHNARVHFGADAPDTDALLLDKLGTFAHEELANEPVAVRLLIGARDLNPAHVSILTNLAEAYFAAGQYKDFARMADRLDKLQTTSDVRIAMAALGWATARLTRKLDGPQAARLLRIYQDIANDAHSTWSWNGTMHALKYSRFRFEEVEPILDVLALLKKMVTDETRVELAELLQSPKATRSGAK